MGLVVKCAVAAAGAVLIAQVAALALASPAIAASPTFAAPAYARDFPDPSILLNGGIYWAYSTGSGGRNLQVMSSSDLHRWSTPADPLPILPRWASAGRTWAPVVVHVGQHFVMYYAVRDTVLRVECLSVATSLAPGAPFVDGSTGPLACQPAHGGSIDPNPYLDPLSGRLYLLWKSEDNSIGKSTHIWGQQLAVDGLRFAPGTAPVMLLTESAAWQSPLMEGPTVVRSGATYYLFYGANGFDTAKSGIGYATASSLLGAYSNRSRAGSWLHSVAEAIGPQAPMVFNDAAGRTRMAFAAWYGAVGYNHGGVRALWIGTLGFSRSGGVPTLS
jgi:beta-xylosidase